MKSLDRSFEYVIYERDQNGYVGDCGNWEATPENLAIAIQFLLSLAEVNHPSIIANTPNRTT